MPEPQPTGGRQLIAMVMMLSTISLVVLAYLIYAGTVPLPDETRGVAAMIVGAAALADFFMAIWFFRKGQSS